MKSLTKTIFLTSFLLLILLSPLAVDAACSGTGCVTAGMDVSAQKAGIDPNNTTTNLPQIIGRVINYLFSIVGVIFLTVILIGGFLWMTAGGSEEKVGKAKNLINNGINGMIVIFLAYALVYVIMASLGGAVSGS